MKSKAKCPKCNSKDLTIVAVWKGHIDPSDGASSVEDAIEQIDEEIIRQEYEYQTQFMNQQKGMEP